MDMLNILKNMDAAARGEKPSAGSADVNDMKTILESLQSVEECGMEMPMSTPPMQEPEDKVSMNVTLNARGDAVEELIKLMGGAKAPQDAPVKMPSMPMALPSPKDDEPDMAKLIAMTAGDHDHDEEDMEEEWDNAPDEEYADHKTMIKDLSGGINREKKQYAKAQDGDNAMAVEAEDELTASLKESLKGKLAEKYAELDSKR